MAVSSISNYDISQLGQSSELTQKSLGKDDFLKILTAQLQYQDPMESMDNSEYIAQMAQFSSLEQMQNLSDNLMTLISLQNTQLGASLIGKEVKVSRDGEIYSGIVSKTSNLDSELTMTIDGKQFNVSEIEEIIGQ
ncbi:flagellar hook assembly protein FlgD [Clostridium sp. DL1XJH146]